MKLTILFLGRNGAGPKYSYEMSKALSLIDNMQLQIIIPNNIDNIEDWVFLEKSRKNVVLRRLKFYESTMQFIFTFFNIFNYKRIAHDIISFNPNWIYIPMGGLLNSGIFLFLKKYKKIYTLHDPILHVGEKSMFLEFLKRNEMKSSKKIILLNNFFKKYVESTFQIDEDNISIIPHAGFFNSTAPQKQLKRFKKILFLGRIEKYKGIDLLLDAMEILVKEDHDIVLTIAGKGNIDPYLKKIDNLKNNIIVKNEWLSEECIEHLLFEHDFVVLPYIDASQSGVIPLAYGNGKIVVATNVGALSEQIPEGLGYCVNPTKEDIVDAIKKVYAIPFEEFVELNNKAYLFAKENLTWESSAVKLNEVLIDKL